MLIGLGDSRLVAPAQLLLLPGSRPRVFSLLALSLGSGPLVADTTNVMLVLPASVLVAEMA